MMELPLASVNGPNIKRHGNNAFNLAVSWNMQLFVIAEERRRFTITRARAAAQLKFAVSDEKVVVPKL